VGKGGRKGYYGRKEPGKSHFSKGKGPGGKTSFSRGIQEASIDKEVGPGEGTRGGGKTQTAFGGFPQRGGEEVRFVFRGKKKKEGGHGWSNVFRKEGEGSIDEVDRGRGKKERENFLHFLRGTRGILNTRKIMGGERGRWL